MTKEAYLDMCEALGNTPIPSEIPVEYGDLPDEIKRCLEIWQLLPDDIDSFAGVYRGKIVASIAPLLDLFSIPKDDWKTYLILVNKINSLQIDRYNKNKSSTVKASP